jgi:uncharacterized membrane protein
MTPRAPTLEAGARRLADPVVLARRVRVPGVAVPAAFAITATWLAWQAVHVNSFVWLVDELLYVKYAVGYAGFEGPLPSVHGERYGPPNVLYPLLLSPLVGLFPMPTAFRLAHVVQAVAFASTIFPVYLLARRAGARWGWALLGGLVSVWIPWSVATLVLMTESLAYPLAAWAVLAMVAAVAEPTRRREALACIAVLLATLARTQLVVLAGVFLLAIALEELARRDAEPLRARVRRHRTVLVAATSSVGLVLALDGVGVDLLSGYAGATDKALLPSEWLTSSVAHAARIIVGVGILPAVLFVAWLLHAGSRPRGPAERACVIVTALVAAVMLYQAAYFAQNVAGGTVQERYVIYIVPLIAVGAVTLASERTRQPPRLSLVAAGALVTVVIGAESFSATTSVNAFDRVASGGSAYYGELSPRAARLGELILSRPASAAEGLVLSTAVVTLAALVVFNTRLRTAGLVALLGAAMLFGVVQARFVLPTVIDDMARTYPRLLPGVDDQPLDWVDRALPDGATAGLLAGRLDVPDEGGQWQWTEFWNKRITRSLSREGASTHSGFPAIRVVVDAQTGAVTARGAPEYMVVSERSASLVLEGEVTGRSAYGAVLLKARRPLRARYTLDGPDLDGKLDATDRVRLRVFRSEERHVAIELGADLRSPVDPRIGAAGYTLRSGGHVRRGTVPAGQRRTVVMPVSRRAGRPATVALVRRRVALSGEGPPPLTVTSVRPG